MRRTLVAACCMTLAAGCSSSSGTTPYPRGAESFVSSPPGSSGRGGMMAGDAAAPAPATPTGASGADAARTVEEADVYARAGTTLYVLNAYRGLQIVDHSDVAAPRLVSRLPLGGTPVDLYVRGDVALVLTRDHVEHVQGAGGDVVAWSGSMLWAVDVADPARPVVRSTLRFEGSLETTRLVGDILYVVSNPRPYWYGALPIAVATGGGTVAASPLGSAAGTLAVASVDVSDARSPKLAQEVTFPADGWQTHANVTAERITLSFAGYDGSGATTRFRAIDISDPSGAMVLGDEVQVAGLARDRWSLDFDAATGLFRAVVANGWNAGAKLDVFRWAAAGHAERAGTLSIDVPEALTAARFDGPRVYAVTAIVRDPLWVIDTSNPDEPVLAGHLEMPGQIDYVEPRGDRLVAFGHTTEAGGWWRLHVSLIDVSTPASPTMLKREVFGPDAGWMPASSDDFRKVFLVLDDAGLVVVPFQGWDSSAFRWSGGTQLLAFTRDTLALKGFLAHAGDIKRAFPIATGTLAALSDAVLQTIDARDPATPLELARIDLARSVLAVEVVGSSAVLACGDGWRSGVEIVVTPAGDPDAVTPRARLPLAARSARLFRDGPTVWVLASDWETDGVLQALDLSDPAAPRWRGHVAIPRGAGEGGWWWGGLADAVRVGGFVVVHQRNVWCTDGCQPKVLVFDVSDPDAPRLAGSVEIPGASWLGGLVPSGSGVWAVHYQWIDDGSWSRVRYYADRIDLEGGPPRVGASVNVPGILVAATEGGRLYAWDMAWGGGPLVGVAADAPASQPTTWLHALTLTSRGTARLDDSVAVQGFTSGFVADGGFAYATVGAPDAATQSWRTRLLSFRLEPFALLERQPATSTSANLVAATAGKVFVQAGWPASDLLVFGARASGAEFEQAVPAPGWPSSVTVSGDTAYVASGPYGVTTIHLPAGAPAP